MTLRARLTGAFLGVVLGPVLIGAVFVGVTVNGVNQSRERERLDVAATSLRTAVNATCGRLQATAESAATATVAGTRPAAAQAFVDQGRASAVHIASPLGATIVTTVGAPAPPWAFCATPPTAAGLSGEQRYTALASVVEVHDATGAVVAFVYAAQVIDIDWLRGLSRAAGVDVTLVQDPGRTTAPVGVAAEIARDASRLTGDDTGRAIDRYVRRVRPIAGQPLAFALSVPVRTTGGLLATITAVVLFASLAAIGGAWALARSTTKPLDEIAAAADKVAHGDFDTRVPVRHDDEVGQLGAAFNRMTREMRHYVDALTASRDQLRGHLGTLGDTLAATHDLPRILKVILASSVRATGARAGLVMLVDADEGMLASQCVEGFGDGIAAPLATLRVPLGAGLVGTVAATGVALKGRPGDGTASAPGEPAVGTFLAVPLRVPAADDAGDGSVLGVIALYDHLGDDDFDDTDLRTVQTFASHAAVAVDNVRRHDEAQRLSHTDPLTGLYNYRHLKDLLGREVHRAQRFGRSLCVIVMDLDRFKEVNDGYGHAAGDAVLVEFARRVREEIRGVDLAFRYGGEEFVLLLPETDGLGGATLAQRLGTVIREKPVILPHGTEITVTVSIGVAVFPEHGPTGPPVLEAADDALYAAKAAGRDTFRLAPTRPARAGDGTAVPASTASDVTTIIVEPVDDPAATSVVPGRTSGRGRGRGAGTGRTNRAPGGASNGAPPPRQPRGR